MVMPSHIEVIIFSAFIYVTFAEIMVKRYSRMVRKDSTTTNQTNFKREDIFIPANTGTHLISSVTSGLTRRISRAKSDQQGSDISTCQDTMKGCQHYLSYCESHKATLQGKCDKTCRYCGPKPCEDRRNDCAKITYFCPVLKGVCDKTCGTCGPPKCIDKRSDCQNLKPYCKSHEQSMKKVCEKTCGYCVGCNDVFEASHCAMLQKLDKCHADLRMQDYCRQTCGFCKLPTPAPCYESKYGCCWDKLTAKTSPEGKNCPSCDDKFKRLCTSLKKACISSAFVRNNCHHSCNYCPAKGIVCNDDPEKIHLCQFWNEKFNFCQKNPKVMRHFCPATCKLDCTKKRR